ncbi:three-Cys-motif partner protein TcmP [Myxococcus qinghaiensis]|uniref:three-Cys-motif partner protein TcmP n=1 Tax=Myxococcus qinghaiensis TaxID=2906758 RepID=UPI0020A72526|nr:three-Cys-motif partner protein TcmP [Myxococcus qinghaiensis]MCP3163541.1 three-Cys-motif partner protein TcmP [Myxococcus qinghaiensis]
MSKSFFDEQQEQSEIKASIVTNYFWAWAKVIMPRARDGRIGYIDLFAGPGRYKDGASSTPLMILERAVGDEKMRNRLVTLFNDKDAGHANSLESAIGLIPGVNTLAHKPQVNNQEVGEEIVKMFEQTNFIPTLCFVDPWGYKGLSLRLINSVLKDWACECVFFFNYNRINMGLSNPFVVEHMNALFGEERAAALRPRLAGLSAGDRELAIVEELAKALIEMGGKYVLPFTFMNKNGTRTTHHLVFVSKHVLGYTIMKEIMAGESSGGSQGVATFRYNPADDRFPLLFSLTRPLDDLVGRLASDFSGQQLTMAQVFERHHVGTPYIKRNYKEALRRLEAKGLVQASPTAADRPSRKGEVTFADDVLVKFP